jgi:hypothetical protein
MKATNSLVAVSSRGNYPLIFETNGSERARIDSSGNLLVGTTSTSNITGWSGSATGQVIQGATPVLAIVDSDDTANFVTWLANSGGITYLYNKANNALIFGTNNTERARIDSGGNLLVRCTSAGFVNDDGTSIETGAIVQRHINGTASGTGYTFFIYNGSMIGSIIQSGTSAVTYNTSSDYRLKNTIAPMTGALDKVALLKPCTYKWNVDGSDGQGFIAHELQEVYPDAVTGEKDAEQMQGVDYGKITPLLTAALQEAIAEIQSLKARVAELEAK